MTDREYAKAMDARVDELLKTYEKRAEKVYSYVFGKLVRND